MAIHARDGQIQGLCSLVDRLGSGRSFGQVHQNEHFSTHSSTVKEKEETRKRRAAEAVHPVKSLGQQHFYLDKGKAWASR